MKYEKNEYSEGFQICSWIIAAAFLYWGIDNLIKNLLANWWGWILVAIGLSIAIDQIRRLNSRSKLRNIVKSEFSQNPNITIEEIYQNTGISHKDIKAIIMDLKGAGWLRGGFDSITGKASMVTSSPTATEKSLETKAGEIPIFCPHCGTTTEQDASFCSYCGMKLK